jgi:hypothetical protein
MTARDIIERLHGLGVDLSINGESVHYAATIDAPPADLLAALKTNKAAIIALLRSCPAYTHDEQRDLSDWYCGQSRTDRLRMRRRADALSNEDGIPHHVAVCLAIESERASATEGVRHE